MNTRRILLSLALLALLSIVPASLSAYTLASQAVSVGGPYDMDNIVYFSHTATSITFRDTNNGSIMVLIPEDRMANVRAVVLASRHQPFNFRIRITAPYNPQTQGCTGTFVSFISTPSQRGSGTVNLARSVNRTGGSTIRNVTYLCHTATSISFRDTEGNTAVAVILAHQLTDLLNLILANRNSGYDLTLEITQPYSAASRECRGTYRNHLLTRETGSQQSSSSSSRSGTLTANTASEITDRGDWAIRNLTYLRHTDHYFHFRDSANYAVDLVVNQNHRQNVLSQIAAHPSRLYTVTMRSRGPYNQHASSIIATYISHSAQANSSLRRIQSLSEATEPGIYSIPALTYFSSSRDGLVVVFRDADNNALTINMTNIAQSTLLLNDVMSRENRRAWIRVQITQPYNNQRRQCWGTYIGHN